MHNLRGIDVTIPRNSLTVVTGLSGSGKSTLAFDTLYAEGQRRYVESLSAYARQFLDRLAKPDVEKIEGLSPAISIEQHTTSGNPRSIVATVTEIHDYLRILWGSLATPHCPKCGREVTRQSAEQIVDSILRLGDCEISEFANRPITQSPNLKSPNLKILLLAPVVKGKKGRHEEVFATLKRNGFVRVRVDGETHLLEEVPALDRKKAHNIDVVVDRLVLPCDRTRLTDSVELALKTGEGTMSVVTLGGREDERRQTSDVRGRETKDARRERTRDKRRETGSLVFRLASHVLPPDLLRAQRLSSLRHLLRRTEAALVFVQLAVRGVPDVRGPRAALLLRRRARGARQDAAASRVHPSVAPGGP